MQYFELLSENDVAKIHETTLDVMESVGLDFNYGPARHLFAKAGAKVDGNRVYFPRKLVESYRTKAPEKFILYSRNPHNNVLVGGDSSLFIPANCPPFVSDMHLGRRYGTLNDYENFIKLTGNSKFLDMCSNIPVEPSDIPPIQRNLKMLYATMKNTDKCFMGGTLGRVGAEETFKMVSILFGIDPDHMFDKARVISIPCSLTPLKYDSMMLESLMAYAEKGQPVIVNALAIAGATSPVTMEGTLIVQNAEVLAGIVLAQLVREGTPVVYGGASTSADMRTGALCVGSPEMAMINSMTAQMARFYKVPSRASGALTESKEAGTQAAYESMMNLNTAVNCGVNMILHAAGALESINCMSYEKFIIDDEMCGMVRRIKQGVNISHEFLAFDLISQVGPGGHFLDNAHTLKHCRTQFFMPGMGDRRSYHIWEKKGGYDLISNANLQWKKILSEYIPPELDPGVDRDLQKYVATIIG